MKTDGFYKMTISYPGGLEDPQALDKIQPGYDAGSLGGSYLQIVGEAIDDTSVVVTIQRDGIIESLELEEVDP